MATKKTNQKTAANVIDNRIAFEKPSVEVIELASRESILEGSDEEELGMP